MKFNLDSLINYNFLLNNYSSICFNSLKSHDVLLNLKANILYL